MSWLPKSTTSNEPPPCFGKSWERNDPACAGGTDPAYTDDNGGHVRERCGYFDTCGARVQAGRMDQARTLIPTASLTRPWMRPIGQPQPVIPYTQTTTQTSQQGTQQFAMQQLIQQFTALAAKNGVVTPMQQMGPAMGLQQMMPVNYSIPQYLTIREDRKPGETVFGMLGRELFRSMGKSVGHTLGNFFDTTPLFWREPPRE